MEPTGAADRPGEVARRARRRLDHRPEGKVRIYVPRAVALRRDDGSTLTLLAGENFLDLADARHWFVRRYLLPPEPPEAA